jgi:lipooligosaccharide transport system permease protein
MAVMGLMPSAWGILALPAALLIGFAFAAAGMAATSFMRSWQDFDLVQLVTLPLFLFSATFYPLDVYPEWLQWVAQTSPLYHGVSIIRALTLGNLDWTIVGHVTFLVAMGIIGVAVAARRLERLLLA